MYEGRIFTWEDKVEGIDAPNWDQSKDRTEDEKCLKKKIEEEERIWRRARQQKIITGENEKSLQWGMCTWLAFLSSVFLMIYNVSGTEVTLAGKNELSDGERWRTRG